MIHNPETKIKQIRELKNLTQEFVAESIGLTTRAYSKIECGETQLTINRLNEICAVLGVKSIELLEFDKNKILNPQKTSNTNCQNNNPLNCSYIQEKLICQYEETIQSLKDQIELLNILIQKKSSKNEKTA
ncbi:helix-turn-helix domain-containing protein [Flavobacterium sp. UBA7680]|uniref:helix-turn-helix domain-containing protein n=1 Tax=Flavobacterium sp. UBA7680 TaxID=1946559 RepID=UPI0025C29831|nr:helix-turn-helix transcriptional regulator [Flavobacterium sp. UBA7680]